MHKQQVAIAGSGVAGLTAAVMLARAGHAVTVFEQSPSLGPVGAGVLLQPSGQLVLERMGLLQKAIAHAEPIDRLFAVTHRGKTLIDLPYNELGPDIRAYGIHRGDLFTALYDEAVARGVHFILATRITRHRLTGQTIEPLNEAGESLGAFDLLIAADGGRSQLRQASTLRKRVHEYPHGALWMVAENPAIKKELWQVTHGTRLLCGLLPMGDNRCSLFWSLRKDEKDALYDRGFDRWRDDVLKICPASEPMFKAAHAWDAIRFTTYQHVQMPQCFTDRCIFIGDAAHAMSPHLGQGINLALLDGFILAQSLQTAASLPDAFASYQNQRRKHLTIYAWLTRFMSPFFQSRGFIKGWGRDICLPLMPHVPILRGQMILTMSGLRSTWLGGRLRL